MIPLFLLVYHDCVQLMTHQSKRIGPGREKMIADHVLFAEMPLPSFGTHRYWTEPGANTSVPPKSPATATASSQFWARGEGGWGEKLCPADRVIKNSYEVLSPLNLLSADTPMSSHEFLTADRLVQRTRFGELTITVAYDRPADIGDHVVPAYGFIAESPQFVAFCATRYNDIDYGIPTLFTARSLDGKPLADSAKVRIYHGFGDPRIRLFGREFRVAREEVVPIRR